MPLGHIAGGLFFLYNFTIERGETMFNQYQNMPQMPQMPQYNQFPQMRQYGIQRQEVIRVNGEGGANAYQLMPNSSALLLDETAPIVWLVTTDGAGFKSVQPYEIKPYEAKPPVDPTDLEARIKRLEDIINEKSHIEPIKQTGSYESTGNDQRVSAIQAADDRERPSTDSLRPSQQRQNDTGAV